MRLATMLALLLAALTLTGTACDDVDGPGPIPPTTIPPPAYAAQVFVGSPNAPYDFQAVEVGESKTVHFSILNTLATPADVRFVGVVFPLPGAVAYDYTLTGRPTLPFVLQPGEIVEFDITFAPTVAATHNAWLIIMYTGGRNDIPLTGVGVP